MGSSFRDRHKGQRCYIFGCGPSLNRFDCDRLAADGITICCNASVLAVKSCDYFLFTDPRLVDDKSYFPSIFAKAGKVVAGNQAIFDLCVSVFGEKVREQLELPSPERRRHADGVDFSQQPNILIAGASVVEVAAHVACIMGCSPIILVGVDLKWDGDRKYFHDRSDDALWLPIPGEEHKDHDQSLSEAFRCWEKIKAANPGLPIFVASPDSKLCALYPTTDLSAFYNNETLNRGCPGSTGRQWNSRREVHYH